MDDLVMMDRDIAHLSTSPGTQLICHFHRALWTVIVVMQLVENIPLLGASFWCRKGQGKSHPGGQG